LNGETYTSSGTYTQILTNAAGCDSILTINLTLDFTGLNENQKEFKLYPNPVKDILVVSVMPELIGRELEIRNVEGKKLLSQNMTATTQTIHLENMPAGIYIVQIGGVVQKMVVE
jgi:hypothetical protein